MARKKALRKSGREVKRPALLSEESTPPKFGESCEGQLTMRFQRVGVKGKKRLPKSAAAKPIKSETDSSSSSSCSEKKDLRATIEKMHGVSSRGSVSEPDAVRYLEALAEEE